MDIKSDNSIIEDDVAIGQGTKVWYFAHIRKGAKLGRNCNVGDYVFIDKNVIVGDDVKIGNAACLYQGVIVKDRVFIGNNVVFTNVRKPSATKKAKQFLDTIIECDVSIGANATIVGGVKIGARSIIADGAVVITDVPSDSFYAGNPAKLKKNIKE